MDPSLKAQIQHQIRKFNSLLRQINNLFAVCRLVKSVEFGPTVIDSPPITWALRPWLQHAKADALMWFPPLNTTSVASVSNEDSCSVVLVVPLDLHSTLPTPGSPIGSSMSRPLSADLARNFRTRRL